MIVLLLSFSILASCLLYDQQDVGLSYRLDATHFLCCAQLYKCILNSSMFYAINEKRVTTG